MYVCTYVRTYVRVPYVRTASLLAGVGFALAMNWGQTGFMSNFFWDPIRRHD